MNFLSRDLTRHIQHSLKIDRVTAIMGPRQAGKTTLSQHLIKSDADIQYYNLKDPDTRRALATNARKEFEYFGKHLIVLDEVQQMPSLIELIQLQVDIQPERKGRFLITASNHLLLNRRIKESLAGRVSTRYLFQQHWNQPIIREIKSPSHTFKNIHVHELTRSAQCINSFLQIDEIKNLFQVCGIILTINGVCPFIHGYWC